MKHTLRSPLTGRFIAKRTSSTELVGEHNRAIRKQRALAAIAGVMDALALVILGAAIAIAWGVAR